MFNIKEKLKEFIKSCDEVSQKDSGIDLIIALDELNKREQEIIAEFERLNNQIKREIDSTEKIEEGYIESLASERKLKEELDLLNIELSNTKTLLASAEKALEDRDKTSIKISIKDDNVIGFIYYRLKNVHNENPNVDYMINLNELQQKIKRVIINQNQTP